MGVFSAQAVKYSFKNCCMFQAYSEGFYFSRKVTLSGRFVSRNDGSAAAVTQTVSLGGQGEEESGSELWVQQN